MDDLKSNLIPVVLSGYKSKANCLNFTNNFFHYNLSYYSVSNVFWGMQGCIVGSS